MSRCSYFSGHGTENNLGGYLVTPDATQYDEGVAMSDVLAAANQSAAKEAVIIVDCCHSGALGQLPAISNQNANIREGVLDRDGSRATQPAVEAHGAGLFTTLVCGRPRGRRADVLANSPRRRSTPTWTSRSERGIKGPSSRPSLDPELFCGKPIRARRSDPTAASGVVLAG